jgi:hypothetical protein
MATNAAVTVGMSTPASLGTGLKKVMLQNRGDYSIYLGGSSVSDSDGFEMGPHTSLDVPVALAALESLYAIVDSTAPSNTTCEVRVLGYLG